MIAKTISKKLDAINQVTQAESEQQTIEKTNVIATLYAKARAKKIVG